MRVKAHFDHVSKMYYDLVLATPFLYGYYHRRETDILSRALQRFSSLAGQNPSKRPLVLDVGCATGRVINRLGSIVKGAKFVGVDISKQMILFARENSEDETDYIVADIRRLPLRDRAFDFVYSLEVLEHLENKSDSVPRAIGEIVRVARLGGWVTIESTSTAHFLMQSLLTRLIRLHASVFTDVAAQKFEADYSAVPVAGPSTIGSVAGSLDEAGAPVSKTFWIRVVPEQAFVFLKTGTLRQFLCTIDELASRVPVLRRLGREFIVTSKRES